MNKPKFIFKFFLFLFAVSALAANTFAQTDAKQTQADPCYEVVLQVLVASNDAAEKNPVPQTLSNVVKKLKTLYAFSDYRLTTTYLQRTTSYIEYKSALNESAPNMDKTYPTFSEWSLKGLRNTPNPQGRNIIAFDSFRFGLRIPIPFAIKEENGKTTSSVNYENTGITTMRFSLNESEPTVIGSLAASKPGEQMFLVLTVKPAE